MNKKTVLVLGSTGVVGTELIKVLAEDKKISKIIAFSRREIQSVSDKVENVVIDFDFLSEEVKKFTPDIVYCCLGTTIKKARTKEAFVKVDYEYPLIIANSTPNKDSTKFVLVSSTGANSNSFSFYLRTKGLLEEKMSGFSFQELIIFRPSILDGNREEKRPLENLGIKALSYLPKLSILKRIRPTKVSILAKKMVEMSTRDGSTGLDIIEAESIL